MPKRGNEPMPQTVLYDFGGGLNLRSGYLDVADNESLSAHNVKFFRPDGCISPRPGRRWMVAQDGTAVTSSMSNNCVGIYQFESSAGSMYPVAAMASTAGGASGGLQYLKGNATGGLWVHLTSGNDEVLHYSWTMTGADMPKTRTATMSISSFGTLINSTDYVCMTGYENHLIATWAPSAEYLSCMPPITWDGIGTAADAVSALHISSEPLLGPDDDESGASADRLISTLIGLSAQYCGVFRGYLFLANNCELEMVSSDGSGAGAFSATYHPYRLRWNNPAASSFKAIEESAGGPAWDYLDYLDLDPEEGAGITGYGTVGDEMLVFKRDKTFGISWTGGSDVFQQRVLSDKIGCVSHRSIVGKPGGHGIAWCAIDGVYYYDGQFKKISKNIENEYLKINANREKLACGALWPEMQQAWWSIPVNGADRNNYGLIFDFHHGDPNKECWATADLCMSNLITYNKTTSAEMSGGLWGTDYYGWPMVYDETVTHEVSGTQSGTADAVKASGGFSQAWQSPWMHYGDLNRIKRLKKIKSIFKRNAANTTHLSINVFKNWEKSGTAIFSSARPLSGRSAGAFQMSGSIDELFQDRAGTQKSQGQTLSLKYFTSAAPGVTAGSVSSHNWELHHIEQDVDYMGTRIAGSY